MSFEQLKREMDASRANASHHPFFTKFAGQKTQAQIARFATQWYIAARNHKKAFPYLIATTQDDETRRELIEILRDEYGNGDRSKVHASLLLKFMVGGIGMSASETDSLQPIAEVADFGRITMEVWRDGDPVTAYGYHYALERIAASIHPAFFVGLQGNGFAPDSLEYFRYHSRAEEEHVHAAEEGFSRYSESGGDDQLRRGAGAGVSALAKMWDGFEQHVFG